MNIYHQPWILLPNRIRGKGGREIDKFRGIYPGTDYDGGSEEWIGSVSRLYHLPKDNPYCGYSKVKLPNGQEMFLFEAINLAPEEILGAKHLKQNGTRLGMLVKYLDTQYSYTLQCHPTRAYAKKMWNSPRGKEESWYVLATRDDTPEPPYILLGFKEGITRENFEKYYHQGDLKALEKLCHKVPVHAGDVYFVEAGCPHTIGAGCLILEVQEPSDITVLARRLQDIAPMFREPHVSEELYNERSLGSYIFEGCSFEENLKRRRIPRKVIRQGAWGNESFVIGPEQTTYFSFTELTVNGKTEIMNTGFPQIAIVLEGEGKLIWEDGEMPISKASEVFFPVNIPDFCVSGNLKMILCHPEGAKY